MRGAAHLRSGVAPIIDCFRSGAGGEWFGIVACAEFEDGAGRRRIRIDAVEAKRFLQREAEFGIALQDELEKAFVQVHDGSRSADFDFVSLARDIFPVANLFWFVWKLFVVLETLFRIGFEFRHEARGVFARGQIKAVRGRVDINSSSGVPIEFEKIEASAPKISGSAPSG